MPDYKYFIDGRMPSWRRDNAPSGESLWAFKEYLDIVSGKEDYQAVFKKYNIKTVLWNKPKKEDSGIIWTARQNYYNLLTRFGLAELVPMFNDTLIKDGWINIYEDNVSVIFKAPN